MKQQSIISKHDTLINFLNLFSNYLQLDLMSKNIIIINNHKNYFDTKSYFIDFLKPNSKKYHQDFFIIYNELTLLKSKVSQSSYINIDKFFSQNKITLNLSSEVKKDFFQFLKESNVNLTEFIYSNLEYYNTAIGLKSIEFLNSLESIELLNFFAHTKNIRANQLNIIFNIIKNNKFEENNLPIINLMLENINSPHNSYLKSYHIESFSNNLLSYFIQNNIYENSFDFSPFPQVLNIVKKNQKNFFNSNIDSYTLSLNIENIKNFLGLNQINPFGDLLIKLLKKTQNNSFVLNNSTFFVVYGEHDLKVVLFSEHISNEKKQEMKELVDFFINFSIDQLKSSKITHFIGFFANFKKNEESLDSCLNYFLRLKNNNKLLDIIEKIQYNSEHSNVNKTKKI